MIVPSSVRCCYHRVKYIVEHARYGNNNTRFNWAKAVLFGIIIYAIGSAQPFRLGTPILGTPKATGWKVDPGLGGLQFSVPIGQVPGEVPIPVSLSMGGTFEAYQMWVAQNNGYYLQVMDVPVFATSGFGYIGYSGGAAMQASGQYLSLEDGRTLLSTEFTNKSQGSSLLSSWSISSVSSSQVHSSGQLIWATITEAQGISIPFKYGSTVQNNLPTGFTFNMVAQQFGPPLMKYDIVADKDRVRVFVEVVLGGQNVGLPVIWADRFGHYVTFKWTQVTSGLPSGVSSIVRIDALNQRNQGVTIRYANWNDTTIVHDLMRIDFVNFSGPAALIQGYSGFSSNEPTGFSTTKTYPGASWIVANAVGGMIARPTTYTLGDPLTVPQPSWNNTGAPAGTAPPLPSSNSGVTSRVWRFNYDSNQAEVASFVDPMLVTTSFTYATHKLMRNPSDNVPILLMGVIKTVETDNSQSSPPVRTSTWSRSLPTASNSAWTVVEQSYWSSVGSADSTLNYTYTPMSNVTSLDYSNGFLQSIAKVETSTGLTRSTVNYSSTTTSNGTVGGGLDGTLSLPASMTASRWLENPLQILFSYTDSSGLQASLITRQISIGGTYKTYQTQSFQYNNMWSMLEANQVKQVLTTRFDPVSGTALTPTVTTTNVWDSGTALQLQMSYLDAGTTLREGHAYTYDTTSTSPTFGKLLTQSVYHFENSSTQSTSPRTQTMGYDSGTGLQSSVTTSYQDVPSGNGSVSRTASNFDAADRPTASTDERHVTTDLVYDLYGRKTQVTPSGDSSLSINYQDLWTTVETRDAMTRTLTTDGIGRTIRQDLPDGTYLTYTYDVHGRLASTSKHSTAGHVLTTSTIYDVLDRPTSVAQYDGKTVNYVYIGYSDGTNRVTRTLGSSSWLTAKDAFGQTVVTRMPSGDITNNAFNGMGRLTKVVITPQNGASAQERDFYYDNLGRMTSKIEPETGTQTITAFNALNQPTSITEAGSRTRTIQYDGLGRTRTVNGSLSGTSAALNYTYSGAFLLTATNTVNSDVVTQNYGYYPAGSGARLQTETTIQTGLTSSISYTYTDLGYINTITYPSTRVVTYGRDNLARVTSITSNVNGTIVANAPNQFDEWGNRQLLKFNSGSYDSWAVDSSNVAQLKTLNIVPVGGGGQTWTYSYDAGTGWLNGTGEWSLPPDSSGRLSQASGNGFTTIFQYDGYGNNNSSSSTGTVPSAMNNFIINPTAAPMVQNQLLNQVSAGGSTPFTVVYDPYGEITTVDTGVASGDWLTMTWDPIGRLTSVWQRSTGATESYRYAPSGLRIARTDNVDSSKNRYYAYSRDGILFSSFLGNGSWDRDVVYLEGKAIAEIDGGNVHELHNDRLGTPRVITNGVTGLVEGSQTFGPFGELIAYSGSYSPANGLPLTGYTGHLQAEANGLIYMKGRFYSPAWHSFLNSDQGLDPNQLDQLAYAGGNPFTATDPTGMSWLSDKWHQLWSGLGHAVGWNHIRKAVEVVAAVTVCIVIDIYAPEFAPDVNDELGTEMSVASVAATSNAVVGFAAGKAIGGTWRDAAQGAMIGATLGYGYTWETSDEGFFSAAKSGLYNEMFAPAHNTMGIVMKGVGAGIVSMGINSGNPWKNFRTGFAEGLTLGLFGNDIYPAAEPSTWYGYLGNQMVGEWFYREFSGLPTHFSDVQTPFENALGFGLTNP